jgi:two-component system NtrC family sensor kinase
VEKLREYLTIMKNESARCGDIVKGLLDFARSSGGRFQPHRLEAIVDQTLVLLAHHFDMKQVTVHRVTELADDRLVCDAQQIQQALTAPCINAVEAMPDGGEITVRTSGDAESVRIDIIDTGPGMPEGMGQQAFEPFYTTKGESGGLGLGLSVVYGIVQRHHGTVDLDSKPNQGTTVSIVLPRDPGVDPMEPEAETAAGTPQNRGV